MEILETLFGSVTEVTWQMAVMWLIGGALIFCAIKFDMEPTLLLPMGFGAILVNLPLTSVIGYVEEATGEYIEGPIQTLLKAGIDNELFPLLLSTDLDTRR